MEDLTVKALDAMIDQIIKDNQSQIMENMFLGTNDSMNTEQVCGVMIKNCLALSMKLSVQVTLELLRSAGNLQIDEREIAKLFLKHLSSEKED